MLAIVGLRCRGGLLPAPGRDRCQVLPRVLRRPDRPGRADRSGGLSAATSGGRRGDLPGSHRASAPPALAARPTRWLRAARRLPARHHRAGARFPGGNSGRARATCVNRQDQKEGSRRDVLQAGGGGGGVCAGRVRSSWRTTASERTRATSSWPRSTWTRTRSTPCWPWRGACSILATSGAHLERLGIDLIQPRNADSRTPRFGLPFDARRGITTGISAGDRAVTIRRALEPAAGPEDFVIPGHVLPLAADARGLAGRRVTPRARSSWRRLAGLFPAAVMSEVLTPAGDMARGRQLHEFAQRLGCKVIDVASVSRGAGAG